VATHYDISDIVAHDYVHIDSEIVFNICADEIELLLNAVNQIINELKESC